MSTLLNVPTLARPAFTGTSPKDVMDLLLLTQYFDMLRDVGQSSKAATVFLPHAPQSVASLQSAMRDGFMQVCNVSIRERKV